MKKKNIINSVIIGISATCCFIGLFLAIYVLLIGISSLDSSGWNSLGSIFIIPAAITTVFLVLDLLITLGVVKNILIYSIISSLVKLFPFYLFMPGFNPIIFILLIILFVCPSILNIVIFIMNRKQKN